MERLVLIWVFFNAGHICVLKSGPIPILIIGIVFAREKVITNWPFSGPELASNTIRLPNSTPA